VKHKRLKNTFLGPLINNLRVSNSERNLIFFPRTVLFGDGLLDKKDVRLRSIPFPTRRATFGEVKRVQEILSTVEIHSEASNEFRASFLSEISSGQQTKGVNYTNILQAAFSYKSVFRHFCLQFGFLIFCRKNICKKLLIKCC